MSSRVQFFAVLTLSLAAESALAGPPRYVAVPVHDSSHGGVHSLEYRYDLNHRNQVLGRTLSTSNFAVWDAGRMQDYTMPTGFSSLYALNLNDSGRVVFAGINGSGASEVWVMDSTGANSTFLNSPAPSWHWSLPYRWNVDRSNHVLGTSRDSIVLFNGGIVKPERAAMWSPSGTGNFLGLPDELRDSADLGSFRQSWGAAQSDGGVVVIKATGLTGSPATLITRHYLQQGSGWVPIMPMAGWEHLQVASVGDAGHVVGDMRDPQTSSADPHAFVWQGGGLTDLHRHSFGLSFARDVNRRGHVVGTYYDEVYQGGNFPITVPRSGFVYRDGENYLLNDVVEGGFGAPSIAVAVNDAGVILAATGNSFEFTFLLVPADTVDFSLHVVNSTGDDGDADLTDGYCATGSQLQSGVDECTFRAALEQSNFTSDLDTILFALPADDRSIKPETPLPAISESVWIHGATAGGMVILDGSHPGFLDSLVLGSEGSTIRDVCFQGFTEPALVLSGGGHHTVQGCEFGHDPDLGGKRNSKYGLVVYSHADTIGGRLPGEGNLFHFNNQGGLELRGDSATVWGNRIEKNGYASGTGPLTHDQAHGVTIYGSYNRLGDYFWSEAADTITGNGGAGIFVADGSGNDFRNNRIYGNHGLGIDIAPLGTNPIDTLDADTGPNTGVNSPRFDSLRVHGVPTAYFTILGEPQYGYVIEVSKSDSCNCSGYGEGQQPLETHQVVGDATGRAWLSIPISDTTRVISLTATRDDRSTSEFSRCLVEKYLQHFDHDRRLQHDTLTLFRVSGGQVVPLDTVMADDSARVNLKPYLLSGTLGFRDTVRIVKRAFAQANLKGSSDLFGTRHNVTVDNTQINDTTSALTWDTLTAQTVQDIYLQHSLFSYNLLVSIEWDVDNSTAFTSYLTLLLESMHDLSTYLFDVYDGQVRLDTVLIFGNRERWRDADVRVFAQNNLRPSSPAFALFAQDKAVHIGRRWFRAVSLGPDLSLLEYPPDPGNPDHYQSLGRELARYLHGLGYEDGTLESCAPDFNFGMMDDPLSDGGEAATELSWSRQYASGCSSTEQYQAYGLSCWDWVERLLEQNYGTTSVRIRRPSERNLPAPSDWLMGPWKFKEVESDLHLGPRTAKDVLFDIKEQGPQPQAAAYVDVVLRKFNGNVVYDMAQGTASRDGKIWVLGVDPGDSILAQTRRARWSFGATAAGAASAYSWSFAKAATSAGDSDELTLSQVQGDYPVVPGIVSTGTQEEVRLSTPSTFAQSPELSYVDTAGARQSTGFSALGAGEFAASMSLVPNVAQTAYVTAPDDSGRPFFFSLEMYRTELGGQEPLWRAGNGRGDLTLVIDTAGNALAHVVTVSTSYPVPAAGTLAGSVQAGRVHAVGYGPASDLAGLPLIGINYSDSDLVVPGATHTLEQTLRVYRWEINTGEWTLVGGVPDTAGNVVWTFLPGSGTYALFTQDLLASVGESRKGTFPESFLLAQNFPNPFNPSTTIAFTLPVAGRVTVDILNILGQRVVRLVDLVPMSSGRQSVVWNGQTESGRAVASGPYLYRVQAGEDVQIRKMLLLK